ncbi:MAG: hypothetical protein Q9221_008514 [Calogaya cf. arnoldii]
MAKHPIQERKPNFIGGASTVGNERQFHFQQGPNGDFHQANTVPDSHPIVDNETQQKSEGSPSDNGTSEPITNSSPVATDPHRYSLANQFRATFLYSWLNLLLVFLLIGIAVNNANVEGRAVGD